MKTVHLIETFDDVCHAFRQSRSAHDAVPMIEEDAVPMIEEDAVLHVEFGEIILKKTEKFVIGESIKENGKEFLLFLMTTGQEIPSSRLVIDQNFIS